MRCLSKVSTKYAVGDLWENGGWNFVILVTDDHLFRYINSCIRRIQKNDVQFYILQNSYSSRFEHQWLNLSYFLARIRVHNSFACTSKHNFQHIKGFYFVLISYSLPNGATQLILVGNIIRIFLILLFMGDCGNYAQTFRWSVEWIIFGVKFTPVEPGTDAEFHEVECDRNMQST